MAKSDRDKSRDKSSREQGKSRGERIREFVFGSGGISGQGSRPPKKPDTEPLYALAQELAPIYENIAQPKELLNHPLFRRGVTFLEHPGFTIRDLMLYGQGDNEVVAHMALAALSHRSQDKSLRRELLGCMERVSVWRRYFILEALMTHVPDGQALIGEVFLNNRELHKPYQQMFLGFAAYFFDHRLSGGETPTFAGKLEDLDPQAVGQLEQFLTQADQQTLAPLVREIELWRASFVDRDVLRGAGHLWGESGHSSDGPVIEHPDLTARVEAIVAGLEKTPRRSFLLVGEQGCGKTAIMRAVSRRLARQGWLIFEANGADLVAGQKFIGQFEERLKEVLAQLSGQRKALWYVPEFASLLVAGTHRFSSGGALDMLLPLVESGRLVMIGESRPEAFEKLMRDKPRCQSAFELCRVASLDEAGTLDLARRWIDENSRPEGPPLVTPEVLQEAWLLAGQYLNERVAPGNLLDFLQLARTRLSAEYPAIGIDDLIASLSKLTGLPAAILDDRHHLDTADLRRFFNERIMGQPEAVDCVVERISIIKSGLSDPTRPQGVFLFAGPTGTGKTEIAKAMARYLFGSENRLLRLDMSEFQNPTELDRLIGSRNDDDSAQDLAFRVRKQPFSVVLLDEFEKAHPRVWDLFLQVFDDGRLTDARGQTTDFRHTIILLTSNLGSHAPTGATVGFSKDHEGFRASDVDKAIARVFRREFLNRLDRVVVFRPLSREVMRKILVKELGDIQKRRGLRNRNWEVVWEDSATDFLLDRGFSLDLGARPLKRAVERHLLTPLADTIVSRRFPEGDQFLYIHSGGDRLQVDFIDPHEPESAVVSEPVEIVMADDRAEAATDLTLAGIALAPHGNAAEVQFLRQMMDQRRQVIEGDEWGRAKSLSLSMMSVADFWSSPERFTILGEVEYRERLENGLKSTSALLTRVEPASNRGRAHYSRRMIGQVAAQLLLMEQACNALDNREPWEAFIILDIRTDSGAAGLADRRWLARMRDMYQGWAGRRNMRISLLQDTAGGADASRPVILTVSGFAAYSILKQEEGLHIWEEPSARKEKQMDHHQVLVRVAAQPEELSGEPGADLLPAAMEVLATPLPGAPAIVRHYRELPAPLVKDRGRGWRTGRLDRVLAGDFDLLGMSVEKIQDSRRGEA